MTAWLMGRSAIGVAGVLVIALLEIGFGNAVRLAGDLGAFAAPDLSFHMHPLLRIDCAAYGVVAAALNALSPRREGRGGGLLLLVTAIIAVSFSGASTVLYMHVFDPGFEIRSGMVHWGAYYFAFQYSSLDLVFAALVLGLARAAPRAPALVTAPVQFLSRISYSIYLVHAPLMAFWLQPAIARFGHLGGVLVLTIVVVMVATATYALVERSFLAIRDRWIPTVTPASGGARQRLAEHADPRRSLPVGDQQTAARHLDPVAAGAVERLGDDDHAGVALSPVKAGRLVVGSPTERPDGIAVR
jgi:peptidoglycan/LPS O-acetylase OafA/YrhL